MKNFKVLFILDGYNEQKDRVNYYQINKFDEKFNDAKILISCTEEILPSDNNERQNMFQPRTNGKGKNFCQTIINDFTHSDRKDFINKFILWEPNEKFLCYEHYEKYFNKVKNLNDMSSNPFMLYVILKVLPEIDESEKDNFTKSFFYQKAIELWIQQALVRKQNSEDIKKLNA